MSSGYRGYIVSGPVRGVSFPQSVQHLVVRDYARRSGLTYHHHLTEYAMPGSSMMLASLLDELDDLEGIILFSLYTLPRSRERRRRVYDRILGAGKAMHAALEGLTVREAGDTAAWDDLIDIAAVLPATPFGGRYEKNGAPFGPNGDAQIAAFTAGPSLRS
jgi:sporadic carbohydrate cluster protein (TIGR04323 family)